MRIYLVWTGYEDVEAAFYKEEDADKFIDEYIAKHPKYGGYRDRVRGDFGVTDVELR